MAVAVESMSSVGVKVTECVWLDPVLIRVDLHSTDREGSDDGVGTAGCIHNDSSVGAGQQRPEVCAAGLHGQALWLIGQGDGPDRSIRVADGIENRDSMVA